MNMLIWLRSRPNRGLALGRPHSPRTLNTNTMALFSVRNANGDFNPPPLTLRVKECVYSHFQQEGT